MMEDSSRKRVGFWLGLGIFFMPYFFSWMLLKPGHSRTARIMGFGWLAFCAVFVVLSAGEFHRSKTSAQTFCSRFAVGESFEHAVVAAKSETADEKGQFKGANGEDVVIVRYISAFPLGWHTCEIKGTEGKISNIRYYLYILK